MARKCTCQICKTKGTTDTFYKVTDEKGRSKYYCNKEEYDNLINERQKRYDLLEYIALEILEYEEGQIVPPSMVKKISEMNKFYDFEVIHETFQLNKDTIQYWIKNKNFSSEYGMASYVMKIIEGSINDVYVKWKHKNKQEQKMNNANTINVDIFNQSKESKIINNDNGILNFLDEEDI